MEYGDLNADPAPWQTVMQINRINRRDLIIHTNKKRAYFKVLLIDLKKKLPYNNKHILLE